MAPFCLKGEFRRSVLHRLCRNQARFSSVRPGTVSQKKRSPPRRFSFRGLLKLKSPHLMRSLFLAATLFAVSVSASEVSPHSLAQRARASDRVVVGTVLKQSSFFADATQKDIRTVSEVAVSNQLKGSGPLALSVVQLGGTVGEASTVIVGDATLKVGQKAVFFLKCDGASQCRLVALAYGVLPVEGDNVTYEDMFKRQTKTASLVQLKRELLK
jgi:hypothetical protein